MQHLLTTVRQHEDSAFFQEPVSVEDVPDYYTIVTDPMDLQKMQACLPHQQSTESTLKVSIYAADQHESCHPGLSCSENCTWAAVLVL
jgi:hypothetical protein